MSLFENKLKGKIICQVFNVALWCAYTHYSLRGKGVLFFVKVDLMYAAILASVIFLTVKFSRKSDKQTETEERRS